MEYPTTNQLHHSFNLAHLKNLEKYQPNFWSNNYNMIQLGGGVILKPVYGNKQLVWINDAIVQ